MRSALTKLKVLVIIIAAAASWWFSVRGASPVLSFSGPEVALPPGLPQELWSYFVPRDNPVTRSKVELGRDLFFDKRLSGDGTVSCATCHDPKLAFADGKRVAEGVKGRRGVRNSPTLLNAMFVSALFWDGRASSLEAQAAQPLINPDEMGDQSHDQVVSRLREIPEYSTRFREAFGKPVSIELIARALSAYERTLVSGNSPYDRFRSGDLGAMSSSAVRGLTVFQGKARCANCHTLGQFFVQPYVFFTDQLYRNTGVANNDPRFDSLAREAIRLSRAKAPVSALRTLASRPGSESLGRFQLTGNSLDIGAFRTPSLRNVELTAPYFHDGSAQTLADVIKFYVDGGKANLNRDWDLHPISLTDEEQADLIEFLKALTSDNARQVEPEKVSRFSR